MPDTTSQPNSAQRSTVVDAVEEVRVPVIEERVSVSKRLEETGRVRIVKRVETETIPLSLDSVETEYTVERRPVGELYDERPAATRREGDATVYSVIREVPVVVTRYELVEEIVVTPQTSTTDETHEVERRVERVEVERNREH